MNILVIDMSDAAKRFWENVDKKGSKPPTYAVNLYPELKGTKCWEWLGRKNKNGYGEYSANGKSILAHRFAYTLRFGSDVLLGRVSVCHKCDNPGCVNWVHLFHGSAKMNSVDMMKGRSTRSNYWEQQNVGAQLNRIEHQPSKLGVAGSIPAAPTIGVSMETFMVYPDWKHSVEEYLGMSIPYEWNECVWDLWNKRFSVFDAAAHILEVRYPGHNVIRTGYHGKVVGIYQRGGGLVIP